LNFPIPGSSAGQRLIGLRSHAPRGRRKTPTQVGRGTMPITLFFCGESGARQLVSRHTHGYPPCGGCIHTPDQRNAGGSGRGDRHTGEPVPFPTSDKGSQRQRETTEIKGMHCRHQPVGSVSKIPTTPSSLYKAMSRRNRTPNVILASENCPKLSQAKSPRTTCHLPEHF